MTKSPVATAELLLQVTMLIMRSFSARMRQRKGGLEPSQLGILMRAGSGPCTISELAAHHAVCVPTISKSVSVLVDAGLVSRRTPKENRRTILIELTAAGRRKVKAMKQEADRHVARMLSSLTEAERRQINAALKLLAARLNRPTDQNEMEDQR